MSDYSIYPKAIDGYAQMPLAVDRYSPVNAESVNRLRSAAVNIEGVLGVAPHVSDYDEEFLTVNSRLDDIEAQFDFDLDRAYDGRGIRSRDPTVRGAGREILVDSGAVKILNKELDDSNTIEITRSNSNALDPADPKAIEVLGYVKVVGMTESRMYSNPANIDEDVSVKSGFNTMLIGDITIGDGFTLSIETGANLLIL